MAVTKSFIYRNPKGVPLARIDRVEPGRGGKAKEFFPYLANEDGSFSDEPGLFGQYLPIYRLDEIRVAIDAKQIVFCVEGEGCADVLLEALLNKRSRAGVTTISGGAAAPMREHCLNAFEDAIQVVFLADSDVSGREAARKRSQMVADAYPDCDVRFIDLYPNRDDGSDISDWFNENHSLQELRALVNHAPRIRQLPSKKSPPGTVANGDLGRRRIDLVRLSDIEPEKIEWLWHNRIPKGKVTLLVGDPGAGKSFASLAISAAITNGIALPDNGNSCTFANVICWNGEDGLGDTIRVRAELCGVGLERFHVIRGTVGADGVREQFGFQDLQKVIGVMREMGNVALLIIDPIAALLAGVDAHRDTEVRASLQPLLDLAHDTGAAVLAVLHLRKSEAQRALYRVGGSIGFVGLARSVLLAAADPDTGKRAIAPLKANLSECALPVAYSIDQEGHWWWGNTAPELTAEFLLRNAKTPRGGVSDEAENYLKAALADGPRPTSEIESEATERNISASTLKRARKNLGIKAERVGGLGKDGIWMLSLPKASKSLNTPFEPLSPLSASESVNTSLELDRIVEAEIV